MIVRSVPAVLVIALPSILILSTWSAVNIPREVTLVCAAVDNVPTKAVEVILVAPVITPASTFIVPSNTIALPLTGVILIAPEVLVILFPLTVILSTTTPANVGVASVVKS